MKIVRTAAMIVGAVALVATGVGAVVGGAAFLAATGVSLATVSAIGTVAGLIGTLTAKKPGGTVQGSQTDFKLDPQAHVPIMVGRTFSGGNIVHRDTWGTDNQYQGFVVVYSGCGPINAVEGFYVDRVVQPLGGGGAALGGYAGWLWFQSQRGLCPEPAAVPIPVAGMPGVDATSKLSGMAAGGLVIKFDKKGKKFQGGTPRNGIVGEGVLVYDPRLDSTYPGGDGPCRAGVEATYVYDPNPWLGALTFAIGYRQNGKRVGGVGAGVETIDVAAFVEAANIADANGWVCGGVISTGDSKWDVLKRFGQAGGGEPVWLGARLSCTVSAPRVSVCTIRSRDVRGEVRVVGTQTRRGGRINGVIPVFRSEAHGWEMIPANVIRVDSYVAEDRGEQRTRESAYPLVQDLGQVGVLAAYEIVNGREYGPVSVPCDPAFLGVAPGMCVDLDIPEARLAGQYLCIGRTLEPGTSALRLEFKSETPAKHPFALGASTTAPPTPSLAPPDDDDVAEWYSTETEAQAAAYIRVSGARGVALSASADYAEVANRPSDGTHWLASDPFYRWGFALQAGSDVDAGDVINTLKMNLAAAAGTAKVRLRVFRRPTAGGTADTLPGDGPDDELLFTSTPTVGALGLPTDGSFADVQFGFDAVTVEAGKSYLFDLHGYDAADGNKSLGIARNGGLPGGLTGQQRGFYNDAGVISDPFALSWSVGSGGASITVSAHSRDYPDRTIAIEETVLAGAPLATPAVYVYYDDVSRRDTTPAMMWTLDYEQAVNSSALPFRHYVGYVPTPAAGGADTGGDPPPYPGGGGFCVSVDALVLMADGSEKPAGFVKIGDVVRTRHERTLEWMDATVTAAQIVPSGDMWEALGLPGTGAHRVWIGDRWASLRNIKGATRLPDGLVVKLSVAEARTYVANGLLSHNIKEQQQAEL